MVENNIIVNNSFHPHVWYKHSQDIFRHNIVFTDYRPDRGAAALGQGGRFQPPPQGRRKDAEPAIELQNRAAAISIRLSRMRCLLTRPTATSAFGKARRR